MEIDQRFLNIKDTALTASNELESNSPRLERYIRFLLNTEKYKCYFNYF